MLIRAAKPQIDRLELVRLLGMTQALSNPAPIARYPWYTLIDPSHLPSYGQASLDL